MIVKRKRKSKFGNKKVTRDDQTFDSKAEYKYYAKLKRMQAAGEVLAFETQKTFIVFDGFTKTETGKKYQAITYIADFFVTYANGEQVVIDVKGADATAVFAIKFKLFHARYPYHFIIARLNYKTGRFTEKETLK